MDFPAAQREIPFGRHAKSDGTVDFTELEYVTCDATNAPPRTGPAVISEILYAPATNHSEFVEIVNISSSTQKMYDPAASTNAWKLSGAVDYTFPQGLELAPGEVVVVCATNPAAFRAQYGLDASVRVYGPWSGALDKSGENLRLRYPGDPEPLTGFVPYYRMDHVDYRPTAPWPTAATNAGTSLARASLGGYGNDPATWTASATDPTPGEVAGVNHPPILDHIGNISYPAGSPFSYTLTASDPDLPPQPLDFSATGLPSGLVLDAASGEIAGTCGATGSYTVTATVSDGQSPPLSDSQDFILTFTAPFELTLQPPAGGGSGTLRLGFNALVGENYLVEYTDSLIPADWKPYRAIQAQSNLEEVVIDVPTNQPVRYYRIDWNR